MTAATSQAEFAANLPEVILSRSAGVHHVRDEVGLPSACVVDAVTLCCPSRRRKVSDEGSARSHARVPGGVLDGARRRSGTG